MTSRQTRRERREAERKSLKAEYQAAKAQARFHSDETDAAAVPSSEPIAPQPVRSRAEINRVNSVHSTGPRSAAGKTRSSQNSFKHGLYSSQLVIAGEDPAELDALRADLIAEHRPVNQTEHILVNEIAEQYWRIRRMRGLEARAYTPENLDDWCESGLLALLQRTMSAAERGLHKALTALQQQRKDRGAARHELPAEETPMNGFVFSETAESGEIDDNPGFVPAFSGISFSPDTALTDFDPDRDLRLQSTGRNGPLEQPAAA